MDRADFSPPEQVHPPPVSAQESRNGHERPVERTVKPIKVTSTAVAAHITIAALGGSRYSLDLQTAERKSANVPVQGAG